MSLSAFSPASNRSGARPASAPWGLDLPTAAAGRGQPVATPDSLTLSAGATTTSPTAKAPAAIAPAPVPAPTLVLPTFITTGLQAFWNWLKRLLASPTAPAIAPAASPVAPAATVAVAPTPSPTPIAVVPQPAPAPAPVAVVPTPAPGPVPPAADPAQASPAGQSALAEAVGRAKQGQTFALGAGTYEFANFGSDPFGLGGEANVEGLDVPASAGGIAGAGIDRTVLRMAPHSSTKAGEVPTADGETNQLSLLRVTGSPDLHDFTLLGTDQGHLYNGLRVHEATNARVTNVKIVGMPGNFYGPPGETFGLEDYRSTGSVYRNLEVDGANIGASGFGVSSSSDVTIDHANFHNNVHACGATFWQTRNATVSDVTMTNNQGGFNMERCSGTFNLVRPVFANNRDAEISVNSDQESTQLTIVDPQFTGDKLRIQMSPDYMGVPNKQRRDDIHVIIGGVDRTADVVQWDT